MIRRPRRSPSTARWSITACLSLLLAGPATAQLVIDPIAPQDPIAPPAPTAQAQASDTAALPTFLKPGTRLIYASTAQQTNPNTPQPTVLGGKGFNAYDVVAHSTNHVHILSRVYAPSPQQPNGPQHQIGLDPHSVSRTQPTGDAALWMPKTDLDAMQSSNDGTSEIIVERGGTLQAAGQTYKTVVVAVKLPNQTSRTVYDADSGLMLSRVIQQGNPNVAFNERKRSGSSEQLVVIRQLALPWLNAPSRTPAWVTPNATLRYQGQIQAEGTGMFQTTAQSVVSFNPSGKNWSTASVQTQLFINGQPHQQPVTTQSLDGPGNTLGFWKDPNVLTNLQPGVLDQDPVLRSKLSYAVQDGPQGRLGVFIEQDANDAQVRVYGYNLQTGVLTFQQIINNVQRQTITATLAAGP